MFGNHIDGAFAEYVKAPAKDAIPLPLDLPLEESCIIADALSTPFHAVRNRARVLPGDTVAVFGCGGVGINVVQIAVACGAKVLAVDVSPEKLELAVAFGASEVVLPKEGENVAKTIRGKTDGGVDVAIEAIGNPITLGQAFDSVKRGGRLCIVGYSDKPFTIAAAKVMFHEIEIVGSLGCRPVDYPRIIEMIRAGRVQLRPLVTGRFPLSEVNAAIDTLRSGKGLRNIVVP
ncbi:MAG: zinc-binding dehydrogenase, partial [Planctomycetota bacterium]